MLAPLGLHCPSVPSLSILILSFNREAALRRTLRELSCLSPAPEIILADNASTDSSRAMVADEFPHVRLLALSSNVGVAGFNQAAALATGDLFLILDDDAWPEPHALDQALGHLSLHPRCAAVALLPVHPQTRRPEWPFLAAPHDHFPVMGCGNLVRRAAWQQVGGYEERFFLYRNDADLAMKLLAAGHSVHANPAWVVLHDSPAAARKSPRWLHLATRNWCWMIRRHARGTTRWRALALGIARALLHAGANPLRFARVIRGVLEGLFVPPPPLPAGLRPDGSAVRQLLALRRGSTL